MDTNQIICLVTCLILLVMNFIACCFDCARIDKLSKRIKALEGDKK